MTEITEQISASCYRVLYGKARHKCLHGGRGSGKSFSSATRLVTQAAESRKRIVCARQFQNSIRNSSKELITTRIRALGLSDQFDITERMIRHSNGSTIIFIGLERNPESIHGLEGADLIWIEEAQTINSTSLETLIPTIRAKGSEFIWTWNPNLRTDPVDAYFRGPNGPPANTLIAEVTYLDNPGFEDTELPAEMAAMKAHNFQRYEHIWLGRYDENFESRVFTNVKTGYLDVPSDSISYVGLDFGYNDPTALAKFYVLPESRQIYIVAEAYTRGLSLDDLPEFIGAIVRPGELIRADSARPELIEHLSKRGYGVVGVKKGPNSVREGITRMQNYAITVHPDCENTRTELSTYSWRTDKRTGLVIPQLNPVGADHLIDCVRYALADVDDVLPADDPGFLYLFDDRRRGPFKTVVTERRAKGW